MIPWSARCLKVRRSHKRSLDYPLITDQIQAIITLIEKKGKDKRNICNWRPISLINDNAKIGAKAIATKVLPGIIHHNQNAFIKVRIFREEKKLMDS